jgi:hypothetical protein
VPERIILLEQDQYSKIGEVAEDADSERCRSAFRGDGDRHSELMPITIPS